MEHLKTIGIGFIAILIVASIVGLMFLFPKILAGLVLFVVLIFACWIIGIVIKEGH